MEIRFINSDDLALAEDFCDAYESNYDWRVAIDPNEFISIVADDIDYYLGAFAGSKIIGVVSVGGAYGTIDTAKPNDALLSDLFVLPNYRSSGVGHKLMEAAIEVSANDFGGDIYGDILDDDLIDYYASFGFESLGGGLIVLRRQP